MEGRPTFALQALHACYTYNLYKRQWRNERLARTKTIHGQNKKGADSFGSAPLWNCPKLSLARDGCEQVGLHQCLKLLVVGLEMELQLGTVGVDGKSVDSNLLNRRGVHLLVEHASLD